MEVNHLGRDMRWVEIKGVVDFGAADCVALPGALPQVPVTLQTSSAIWRDAHCKRDEVGESWRQQVPGDHETSASKQLGTTHQVVPFTHPLNSV